MPVPDLNRSPDGLAPELDRPEASIPGWLPTLMRLLALGLGAVHTTVAVLQQSMNEDGIGYLDMGDAWFRGDWEMAINGVWSPLYSWILGLVIAIFEPSVRWEFPAAQMTNFAIYAVALVCFEFFWRELSTRRLRVMEPEWLTNHPAAWLVLGYSLFIWSSLNLVQIWAVTPDMTVAALVYLGAGLFLRLAGPSGTMRTALTLGLILGAGYLAKSVMMPLGIVFLLLILLIPAAGRDRVKRAALATAGFLLVAGPFFLALSVESGKPTFSDVGRFTYLKHVNEMSYPDFHDHVERLEGEPTHPPRLIFDDPPVYEFSDPVGGTYPMAYDPGYWTAGLRPTVTIQQQLRAVATNAMVYFELFFRQQGAFLGLVALLVILSLVSKKRSRSAAPEVALILWSLAALGLYSLVHVETRYIAPFVILFWAGCMNFVQLPNTRHCRNLLQAGALLLIAIVWVNIGARNLEGLAGVAGFTPLSETGAQGGRFSGGHKGDNPVIAEGLMAMGLGPGDHVGFIGYSYSGYWARLARLKIVAEIHPSDEETFWQAGPAQQHQALRAFAEAGVVAVIAAPPNMPAPAGWRAVGETDYLVYTFK